MDDPTPPIIDDAVNLATVDLSKKSTARMMVWKFFKYVCWVAPALPVWIGGITTPVIAQARPGEAQPVTTAERQGSAEVETEDYMASVGSSPDVVQVSTADLVTIGALTALDISKTEYEENNGTNTSTDRR